MYKIKSSKPFDKSYKRLIVLDKKFEKRILKVIHLLTQNPKHPSLKSHMVDTKRYGESWSSWVTGDIRIIWDYDSEDQLVLLLLDIGSHSGTHKVYK